METGLTPSQRRVFDFLKEFAARNRFAPSAKEIAARFGIAEKNAFYYLDLLERKGYIRRKRHHPRRIEFTGQQADTSRRQADDAGRQAGPGAPRAGAHPPPRFPVRVPVLGRVPAGSPREAIELAEEELFLDPSLVGDGDVFSLRVKGDSMEGAHIREGDYVLVRAQETAADGEIVVAVVDGEATVKSFRRREGLVRLEAANPAYPPIVVSGDGPSFRIAGKVVGVFRRL